MKTKVKKILLLLSWLIIISGVTFLSVRALKEHKAKTCLSLDIEISSDGKGLFFTENQILKIIEDSVGEIEGALFSEIDMRHIKRVLGHIPYFENLRVYSTLAGEIKIEIKQRTPVIRVFNTQGESFYIDKKGVLMPLSRNYTAHVLIAGGHITESYRHLYDLTLPAALGLYPHLLSVYTLALSIVEDEYWHAMIDQILIAENGDIEFTTRLGTHKVILGDLEDLHGKLGNLKLFYQRVLKKKGWNAYNIINLKYKNRVICS